MKGLLTAVEDPGDPILMVIFAVYWIFIAAYIEEWFWRSYYWHVLYYNRLFDRLWISFTWGLMYVVAIFLSQDPMTALVAFIVLGVIGYIFTIIRWEWSYNAMFIVHMGINGGIAVCWYLAGQGKF